MTYAPLPEDDNSITALRAKLGRGNRDAEARTLHIADCHSAQLIIDLRPVAWQEHTHFFAMAAQIMRAHDVPGISGRTVKRDWDMIRARIHGELTKIHDAG